MEKQFGKLSLAQFQRLVGKLPEIRGQMDELPVLMRNACKERIAEILGKNFHWAVVYELPFISMIALVFMALGRLAKVEEIANAADPQEAALEWMEDEGDDNWSGGDGGLFKEQDVVGLVVAMQRNILSIMLYHRTLCALVQEVRDGADESLFLAVRVDRSIVACPTFADRIARAELEDDRLFFQHLRSALKGPSKKHWEAYRDLRYALHMLRELGFDKMSDAQLEELLVHKLKVYPNVPSARKNLRKQFTESKKIATTSKRTLR